MHQTFIFVLAILTFLAAAKVHPEAKLYFLDYCKYFGYPAEAHDVITDDGYILKVFRIQKKGSTIKSGLNPCFFNMGFLIPQTPGLSTTKIRPLASCLLTQGMISGWATAEETNTQEDIQN